MSEILARAFAPLLVTLAWLVAIYTMASEPVGGLEPLLAGLIGGAAMTFEMCVGDRKRTKRVFGFSAPVAAGSALVLFVGGIGLSLAFDPKIAAGVMFHIADIGVSLSSLASFAMRVGLALAVASIMSHAAGALIESIENGR